MFDTTPSLFYGLKWHKGSSKTAEVRSCPHTDTIMDPCVDCCHARLLDVGWGELKRDKNSSNRQQDAHGPEKDGWLNPGNGEKSRGRRYF